MKKNKNILILIVLCLVLLAILGTIYYNLKKNERKPVIEVLDPKDDDVLNLSGFGVFFDSYSGYLKSSEIAKHLEKITIDILPNMFDDIKNYEDEELEKYYNENSTNIINNFGIDNSETFLKLIHYLKNSNLDLNTWYRLDILKDTFNNISDKTNYAKVEYEVAFKNDQTLRFLLYVSKKITVKPTYIVDVIN